MQVMADVLLHSPKMPWFEAYLDHSNYSEKIREEGWIFGQIMEGGL